MSVIHVENDEEYQKVIEDAGEKRVVVKCSTAWCGPCKRIAPFFKQLAEEFPDTVCIAVDEIDEEEFEQTLVELEVRAFPTFVHLYKDEEVRRVVGTDRDELRRLVKGD